MLAGPEQASFSPNINRKSVDHPEWLGVRFNPTQYLTYIPWQPSFTDDSVIILLISGTTQVSKAESTSSTPTATVRESRPTPANSLWRAGSQPWWRELRNNMSVIMWVVGKLHWNPNTIAGGISVRQTTVFYIIEIHCSRWPPPPRQ